MVRVAGIVEESITDGPGIRFTLFVQGCPRRCPGCHNPEAQPFEGGDEMETGEIYSRMRKNPLVSGLTLTGGEPFSQASALLELAQMAKRDEYDIAIYTGFTFEELTVSEEAGVRELLSLADYLVDGPFLRQQRNLELPFRGSENQRILDVKESLSKGKAVWDASGRWE